MAKNLKFLFLLILFFSFDPSKYLNAAKVDSDFFYDKLAPYGEWINVEPYGWVWSPYDVLPDWQPYTDGQWTYIDNGWTFVSDDDWGWAVYHYGRWDFNDDYGWIWVPGTVWGPAWVFWRYGDGYLGWTPLPPQIGWSDNGLVYGSFDIDNGIAWNRWSFIDARRFNNLKVKGNLEIVARNVTLIERSKNMTNYQVADKKIIDNNLNIEDFERFTGGKIIKYNISDAGEFSKGGIIKKENGTIELFRPAISQKIITSTPKNILPANKKNTPEEIQKQYDSRILELKNRNEERLNHLKQFHENENKVNDIRPQQEKIPQDELSKRHDNEMRALNEQHNRENHVVESNYSREMNSR